MNKPFADYRTEAQARWGQTDAYKEHAEKTKHYSQSDWAQVTAGLDTVFADFALCMKRGMTPDSDEAQHLVAQLQRYITDHYYNCTNPILAGLGQMYTADPRFQGNIDRHAEGTAAFTGAAIASYCAK